MKKFLSVSKAASLVAAWVVLLVICPWGTTLAHADPWGDIHPHVSVMDGKFSITFRTMLPRENDDESDGKPFSRMIYNEEGTLFAPRHPFEESGKRSTGPTDQIQFGDETLVFRTDSSSKLGYQLREKDGKVTPIRLPWPENVSLGYLADVLVTPDGIAITGKEKEGDDDGRSLFFYWFPHPGMETGTVVDIGPTECIYDFPVASNLAWAGGLFWLAYMKGPEKEGESTRLMLWSWKPGEKEGRVETLDSPGDWNSSLSMAAIGDRLCLAYHCKDDPIRHAKIVTVFRKAE